MSREQPKQIYLIFRDLIPIKLKIPHIDMLKCMLIEISRPNKYLDKFLNDGVLRSKRNGKKVQNAKKFRI